MTGQSSTSSKKWIYAFAVTLAILIINTTILTIAYFNIQNEFSNLKTTLANQEQRLQDLQQQISIQDYMINHTSLP